MGYSPRHGGPPAGRRPRPHFPRSASIRRELLDHVIVFNESHARRLLRAYQSYYNRSRTHLSLAKDAPEKREVQAATAGTRVVAVPEVGGLHHRYERRAA